MFFKYRNSKKVNTESISPLRSNEKWIVQDNKKEANVLSLLFSIVFTAEKEIQRVKVCKLSIKGVYLQLTLITYLQERW